jgi:hypothetical protein
MVGHAHCTVLDHLKSKNLSNKWCVTAAASRQFQSPTLRWRMAQLHRQTFPVFAHRLARCADYFPNTSDGILSWFGNIKAPACVPINTTSNTPPQSEFFDSTKQSINSAHYAIPYTSIAILLGQFGSGLDSWQTLQASRRLQVHRSERLTYPGHTSSRWHQAWKHGHHLWWKVYFCSRRYGIELKCYLLQCCWFARCPSLRGPFPPRNHHRS